jgi:hypothetical protein
MVLRDDAIEILHGEMKVATEEKNLLQSGSLFGSDRRFFAISHPTPTTTERPSMPGFSRSCRSRLSRPEESN